MKALILSGGTGTRLRPLTYTSPKQLIPLANKPILFYLIEKIVKVGIRDIGIIVGDTQEEIKRGVGSGEKWNVNITYIYQSEPLGLAHAVKTAASFIGDSDFLMLLGDNMFNMDLDNLIGNFYAKESNTSILLHQVDKPSQFGVAVVEHGYIVKLAEKPQTFISNLIITGVYVFDKSIFTAIDQTLPSARGELEITDAIQKQLDLGGKVTYEKIKGWWKDTGKEQDILEANRLLLDDIENEMQSLPDSDSLYMGKLRIGKNVKVVNSIIMGPVVIDDDSMIVNSYIGPYTSISKGVKISNCEMDNCIILGDTQIENVTGRISGSLIGKNVLIQSNNKRPFANSFVLGDNSKIRL
ncbi:MAG: glucose-1-phosphate thymidylyltransferase [Dehalobacterium sp.]